MGRENIGRASALRENNRGNECNYWSAVGISYIAREQGRMEKDMITEQEIIRYIGKQPKHIAGFKQIAHDLAVKGKDRRPLQQLLTQLTPSRKLKATAQDRWSMPTTQPTS